MPRPPRVEFPDALFHVTTRGVLKNAIVRDDHDRVRWCEYLKQAVARFGLELYAFALLDNHFHLFLGAPNTNLAAAMQYLNGSYAAYFNARHERKGHLFENRYRAVLIESQGHYTEVSRYIHLNPVRAGIVKRPEQYPWSSYPGYYYGRMPLSWVNYSRVLAEFVAGGMPPRTKGVRPLLFWKEPLERCRQFVAAGIGQRLAPPWARAVGGWLLGSPKFVAKTYALLAKDRGDTRWDSRASLGNRAIDATLDKIATAVCKEFSATPDQLKSRDFKARPARRAFALLARVSAGHSLQSVAACLGITSRARAFDLAKAAEAQKPKDDEFRKQIARLDSQLT